MRGVPRTHVDPTVGNRNHIPNSAKRRGALLVRRTLIVGLLALAGCGGEREREQPASAPRPVVKPAAHAEQPPLPKPRPKVVEPVAGRLSDPPPEDAPAPSGAGAPEGRTPKPVGPASAATRGRGDAPSAINGGTHTA